MKKGIASSVRVFCAQNSQREGESSTRGSESVFRWDVWIGAVGSSVETAGPYVIPRSGVPRHVCLYTKKKTCIKLLKFR